MPHDWDIKSRSPACQKCETEFKDKESYYSCLAFGKDGYQRQDYCAGCWDTEEPSPDAFSVWQGVFHLPPPKPEEPVKKENAETLLRRLIEEDDAEQVNVIFILAVMLERKRILAEKEVRLEEGASIRVYEHKKSGETFVVRDPHLRLDRLEAVQAQVIDLLEGQTGAGGDSTGEPAPSAADQPENADSGNDLDTPRPEA